MNIGRECQMHLWAPIVTSLNPHVVSENNEYDKRGLRIANTFTNTRW
jgi:hypothetical protein